ncbi:MAG: serine hydrolase domain-containing protein [Acidobacteriaceae bacterium]
MKTSRVRAIGAVAALACTVVAGWAQTSPAGLRVDSMPAEQQQKIDAAARQVLDQTGVASASIAIVRDGKIVYTQAYGTARLATGPQPEVMATPAMRYSIGSISKQFTAAAILMLEQEGKLTLDDPVGKWLPDLTDAQDVTIREVLSHTSGYQDFWPEDYVMPPMLQPTTAQHILDTWAKKPLDFPPGTQWQYSNTNYVIAGRIAEIVSGEPLIQFLKEHVFEPLHMDEVWDSDASRLGPQDAQGTIRYALGPPRPAPKEGRGWMFAAGELAMPAYDLAQWDISVMDRTLLTAKSYDELEAPVLLKDGANTHYALGLEVSSLDGHAYLAHSGEVSGFVDENMVFPQDKVAIVVLTNEDASRAAGGIARDLAPLLLGVTKQTASEAQSQALQIFEGLQQGTIDRSLFTDWCNAYFDQQALADFQSSLGPLGKPASLEQSGQSLRGGMTFRAFRVTFPNSSRVLTVTTYTEPDGKLEQYLVMPSS